MTIEELKEVIKDLPNDMVVTIKYGREDGVTLKSTYVIPINGIDESTERVDVIKNTTLVKEDSQEVLLLWD